LPQPAVFDADALWVLAHVDRGLLASHAGPRILTPHAGEMLRLLGADPASAQAGDRAMLEREAAVRFAASVSDADLKAIEDAHLGIVKRAQSGDIDDHLLTDATMVDWGLHDLMIDASNNELLSDVYRINSLRVRLIKIEGTTLSADVLLPAMQEHLWFIDALKQRDPVAVAQRLTHHIESAHRRVLGLPRPELPWTLENLK
jgi:DNA-binding GntR family transcriptional regulator